MDNVVPAVYLADVQRVAAGVALPLGTGAHGAASGAFAVGEVCDDIRERLGITVTCTRRSA